MSFRWPAVLWAMAPAPAAIVAYVSVIIARRRRVRVAPRPGDGGGGPRRPGWRRHLAAGLVLLGTVSLLLAVARPYRTLVKPRRKGVIELVIDASGTMHAPDLRPTRLGAVQQAVMRFVDRVPSGMRVGVVSFAEDATTLTHPTADRDAVLRAIASLRAEGPTAMASGIGRALDDLRAAHPVGPAVLVLVSDGTSQGDDPLVAARAAGAAHVPVHTVAVGAADAMVESIPIPPDQATMAGIAALSGARAANASSAAELETVFADLGARLALVRDRQELALPFVVAAALLAAAGAGLALGRPQPGFLAMNRQV
jgi:Ca-activated chloride channel homolog